MDSFPFLCSGLECGTEDEAWASFKLDVEQSFAWIPGVKVWRTVPTLFSNKDFAKDMTVYRVGARCLALKELPEGFVEATINEPYESSFKEPESEAYILKTPESEK